MSAAWVFVICAPCGETVSFEYAYDAPVPTARAVFFCTLCELKKVSVGLPVREKPDEATHGAPPRRAGWSRHHSRTRMSHVTAIDSNCTLHPSREGDCIVLTPSNNFPTIPTETQCRLIGNKVWGICRITIGFRPSPQSLPFPHHSWFSASVCWLSEPEYGGTWVL